MASCKATLEPYTYMYTDETTEIVSILHAHCDRPVTDTLFNIPKRDRNEPTCTLLITQSQANSVPLTRVNIGQATTGE